MSVAGIGTSTAAAAITVGWPLSAPARPRGSYRCTEIGNPFWDPGTRVFFVFSNFEPTSCTMLNDFHVTLDTGPLLGPSCLLGPGRMFRNCEQTIRFFFLSREHDSMAGTESPAHTNNEHR